MRSKKKKFVQRGRHVTLPIIGDVVSEVNVGISRLATIIFRDPEGGESQIQFEEAVTLLRGGVELKLTGSRPGRDFDPKQLYPLLDLLGATVADAWAHNNGPLEISLSNDWTLRVVPESGYEAWHFQYPRPDRRSGGDANDFISLHGDEGRLI